MSTERSVKRVSGGHPCGKVCITGRVVLAVSCRPGESSKRRLKEGSMSEKDRGAESFSEFLRIAGLRVEEVSGARVRGWIELSEQHHTPWGMVHGGVYAAAVESAASIGASAAVEENGQFAVGVNNTTDFLRPMKEGRVEVIAEPIMQGKSQQLWQVIISRSEDGKEVARGQVRLQNVPLPV